MPPQQPIPETAAETALELAWTLRDKAMTAEEDKLAALEAWEEELLDRINPIVDQFLAVRIQKMDSILLIVREHDGGRERVDAKLVECVDVESLTWRSSYPRRWLRIEDDGSSWRPRLELVIDPSYEGDVTVKDLGPAEDAEDLVPADLLNQYHQLLADLIEGWADAEAEKAERLSHYNDTRGDFRR